MVTPTIPLPLVWFEQSHGVREPWGPTALEAVQHAVDVTRWVSQIPGLFGEDLEHQPWVQVELVQEEVVRVGDCHPGGLEAFPGEVLHVERDDHLGTASDRCGQHVTIVVVGEIETGAHRFPTLDERVLEVASMRSILRRIRSCGMSGCTFWRAQLVSSRMRADHNGP